MEEKIYPNGLPEDLDKSVPGMRKPKLLQVSALYSICVLLLIFVGSRVQHREFYSGILITEFILIALPAVLMLTVFRYDLKAVLRLNKISTVNILLIVGIMICALPIVGVLNGLNLLIIKSIFGKIIVNQPPVAENAMGLLINILVIGGSAGICEEILFRGTIQRGFERFGAVRAILITSLLFGLMHVDFQKLLGTFLLGGLIGFIVYRSNSLFGGMIAHFTNNSTAVILAFWANNMTKALEKFGGTNNSASGEIDMSMFNSLPKDQQTVVIIIWAIMGLFLLAFFGGLFALLFRAFIKRTAKANRVSEDTNEKSPMWSLAGLLPGITAVSLIYFIQGLRLRGIPSPALDSLLGLLGLK